MIGLVFQWIWSPNSLMLKWFDQRKTSIFFNYRSVRVGQITLVIKVWTRKKLWCFAFIWNLNPRLYGYQVSNSFYWPLNYALMHKTSNFYNSDVSITFAINNGGNNNRCVTPNTLFSGMDFFFFSFLGHFKFQKMLRIFRFCKNIVKIPNDLKQWYNQALVLSIFISLLYLEVTLFHTELM